MDDVKTYVKGRGSGSSDRASALIEFAALERGLQVERYSEDILVVRIRGALVPFLGFNGPDTSVLGKEICVNKNSSRGMIANRGLPVVRYLVFGQNQMNRAVKDAELLGWPVNVMPARLESNVGASLGVWDGDGFVEAWRKAVRAYGKVRKHRPVLVEQCIDGDRSYIVVVDDEAVSVSLSAVGVPNLVDFTEAADRRLGAVAVGAVQAIPGLPYASVEIIRREAASESASEYVVADVDWTIEVAAKLAAGNAAKGVAGCIVEHYLNAPRWESAARDHHTASAGGLETPGWGATDQ